MIQRIILLSLIFFVGFFANAQIDPYQPMMQLPSAPNAASLGKYADFPVSLTTGTVNVSIPIYTIKTSNLSLPLSISYHGSGVKVNDKATSVGLGWSLNAGGVINRSLKGIPDEWGYMITTPVKDADTLGYFGDPNKLLNDPLWSYTGPDPARRAHIMSFDVDILYMTPSELARKQYLDDLIRFKTLDSEPDDFSYNFNGHTGKFMFDEQGNVFSSSYDPVKIIEHLRAVNNNSSNSNSIEIITADGTLYKFGRDSQGNEAFEKTTPNVISPSLTSYNNPEYVNSWYLTEVISANRQDTIKLSYESVTISDTFFSQKFRTVIDVEDLDDNSNPVSQTEFLPTTSQTSVSRSAKYLSQILFANGKVVFNNVLDRSDDQGYRLSSIDVYQGTIGNYQKIEAIEFDNDHYFTRDGSKGWIGPTPLNSKEYKSLKLESLIHKRADGTVKYDHEFSYNSTALPVRNSKAQDYWGYYNGESNTSLIPQATYSNYPSFFNQTVDVNRDAVAQYMKAGVLEEVKYPTGGVTKFTYEPHYAEGSSTTNDVVTSHEQNVMAVGKDPTLSGFTHTPYIEKEFTYTYTGSNPNPELYYEMTGYARDVGDNESNYVTLLDLTNSSTVFTLDHDGINEPQGVNETKSATVSLSLTSGHLYKIIAYTGGSYLKVGGMSIMGTSYVNAKVNWESIASGSQTVAIPVGGLRIKAVEHYADELQVTPSLIKRYEYGTGSYGNHGVGTLLYNHENNLTRSISLDNHFYDYSIYHSENVDIQSNNGAAVEYETVTEYRSDDNSLGKTVYTYFPSESTFEGLPVQNSPYPNTVRMSYPGWQQAVIKSQEDYAYNNSDFQLNSSKEYLYQTLAVKNVKALKAQTISQSGNEATLGITAFNYDVVIGRKSLAELSTTVYDTDGNNPIITVENYTYDHPSFLLTQRQTTNSSDDLLLSKTYYPDNITNVSSLLGLPLLTNEEMKSIDSLKYDYQHRIAIPIQTESYKNSTLLSRERTNYKDWGENLSETGNFIEKVSLESAKSSDALEDRMEYHRYDDYGNPVEISKVNGNHVVYIWGYNHQYPVAKIENTTYSSVENLNYFGAGFDLVDGGLSSNQITQLRSNLSGGLVSTYTYDPLIGVTSLTDPSGYTSYYQYDTHNRLQYIKDKDEKVIKSFDYNYKQTVPQYTVTSTSNGNGTVILSDSEVNEGGNVLVTVTPDSGYQISTITVNGTSHSTASPFTLSNITSNTVVDVQFSVIPPSSSVSPTSMSFNWIDGYKTVTVTASGSWTVSKSASWIYITATSGSGNGTFRIRPGKNTGSGRSGTVTVTLSGVTKTISIYQFDSIGS